MTVSPMMENVLCSEEEHSPPLSENTGGSWLHWENEISSISGLNIDSTSELNGLVEDKEVAARAVALVVNSTRKGIVPLCADIASLLRAKRSLEKKVYLMKRDLEALRSSTSVSFHTSHSTSPTMPLMDQHGAGHGQDRSRPCSRCSQCSVTGAAGTTSANTTTTTNNNNHNHSSIATTTTTNNVTMATTTTTNSTTTKPQHLSSPPNSGPASTRASPRLVRTQSSKTPFGAGNVPSVSEHTPTIRDATAPFCDVTVGNPAAPLSNLPHPPRPHPHHQTRAKRKNSLPEMTSEPSTEVQRVSPKISKETQCAISGMGDTPLEEQFLETVRLNSKLSEELGSARKEIEFLKGRLKELEMKQLARECFSHERYRLQSSADNTSDTVGGVSSDPLGHAAVGVMASCRHVTSRHRRPKSNCPLPSHRVSAPPGSLLYAEPLYGCKCNACEEAMGSDIHTALSAALNEELQKFPIGSNVLVQLGDHVVTKGEKTGRIRYIGHLDKIGQPNMVFVGLELDAPVGHHDGFFNHKRYFFCQKDHGVFVPLHDMVCKVGGKTEDCMENTGINNRMSNENDVLTSGLESIVLDDLTRPRPSLISGMDNLNSVDRNGDMTTSTEMTSLMSRHHHVTSNNNNNNNTNTGSSKRNSIEDYV